MTNHRYDYIPVDLTFFAIAAFVAIVVAIFKFWK
jgi:hypothetical protein